MNARLFVLTGGPGSGKTTLLAALAEAGLATMPEAGRAIIRDQIRIGGSGWHGQDRRLFAELMLGWEMRSWQAAQAVEGPVFFDRGIPDVIGYLSLYEGHVPAHVIRAARLYRYHPTVLLAPPWPRSLNRTKTAGRISTRRSPRRRRWNRPMPRRVMTCCPCRWPRSRSGWISCWSCSTVRPDRT